MDDSTMTAPHVVFLPFPLQGHINPLLLLAKLLNNVGTFHVTFVNTHHCQHRFERFNDMPAFYSTFPNFHFRSVSDGLPSDHPRAGKAIGDLLSSTREVTKQELRRLIIDLIKENKCPTCIIADGIMSFAIDVGMELGIPAIAFRTFSAYCVWTYFHLSKLIQDGLIPFKGSDMDKAITSIPGMENLMRYRDLPGICRFEEANDPILQFFIGEIEAIKRASAIILNTIDKLEAPAISNLGSLFPTIYSLGPLHGLLDNFIKETNTILQKEDKTCIHWLDSQPPKSVIYVSFGSFAGLYHNQLLEFWHGLVNSRKKFLWVIRSDSLIGESARQVPEELENATKERGCIVQWAPQLEVLNHPAVGGFLTHSGWNSTTESILAGVPMICWPLFSDQQVNSRLVSELWRIGYDMKDVCDRSIVEKMVNDLMVNKREEIMKSMNEISNMTNESVKEGGSSYCNLKKLIQDIRSMS